METYTLKATDDNHELLLYNESGVPVLLKWYFDEDNKDMMEMCESSSVMIDYPIHLISYE